MHAARLTTESLRERGQSITLKLCPVRCEFPERVGGDLLCGSHGGGAAATRSANSWAKRSTRRSNGWEEPLTIRAPYAKPGVAQPTNACLAAAISQSYSSTDIPMTRPQLASPYTRCGDAGRSG